MPSHKVLENILCFESRFYKQNSARLKSDILLPPKFLGWLRHWQQHLHLKRKVCVNCAITFLNVTGRMIFWSLLPLKPPTNVIQIKES